MCWTVFESGQLPPERVAWAATLMNRAGQFNRVIRVVEARLRAGNTADPAAAWQLHLAYQSSERPLDARRAATFDNLPAFRPAPVPRLQGGGFFSLPDVRQ